jgi:hypothetical protein
MKKLLVFLLLSVVAYIIGRSADHLVAAYAYLAGHRFATLSVIIIILSIFLAFKYGPRLIKKYRSRNDIYLDIDDDHIL